MIAVDQLPAGWAASSLAELASSIGGGTPPTTDASYWDDGSTPWVSPKDMKSFRLRDTIDRVTDKALERLAIVPQGSVLVVVRSGILSRTLPVAINDAPVVLNQDMRAFIPKAGIDASFLAWQLVAQTSLILETCTKDGTTVASIEAPRLAAFPIPLAPECEQRRIVGAIEELLANLDDGIDELRAGKRKLALYRQSLLKSAVEGTLTAEWRRANPRQEPVLSALSEAEAAPVWLPPTWRWLPVAGLPGMSMSNGRSVPSALDGAKVLRLTAVRNGRIDLAQYKHGAWSPSEANPFSVRTGDLLIVRGNGSLALVGRAGVVPEVTEPIAYPDTLIRLGADPKVIRSGWLAAVWDSSLVRGHLESRARTSAGIYKISQPDIASALVPVPPIAEQDAALTLLRALTDQLSEVAGSIEVAMRAAAAQRQNILRAAFSGRLVPQDPADEPASVLLERIRAERAQPLSSPPAQSSQRRRRTTC